MTARGWLVDTSALVWLARSPDRAAWADRMDRGLVNLTTVTLLELGFSARDAREHHEAVRGRLVSAMPVLLLTPAAEARAVAVQELLAGRGLHRAPSVPNLLVAAAAEVSGLTVLHVDKDFELIAEVTGQPAERLAVPA